MPTPAPSFDDLTAEQRAAICNGCGAKGGWFRPPQLMFRASCDKHDYGYWLGGDEAHRLRCDAYFFGAMVTDAALLPIWRRPTHLLAAWLYYRGVRWFGRKSFAFGERKTMDDLDAEVAQRRLMRLA